jgi:hypothetical protein
LSVTRRLALGAAAGAVTGLVVGGIWGRIFMFVLASLNPEEHGLDTDDGFEMGQVTVGGTINLLTAGMALGAIGGLVFLAVRGLRFGPPWFRTATIALGSVLVIGPMMVHTDGVDFNRLQPIWLAVVMTLSVPLLSALLVTWLGDRWLGDGPTVWQRVPPAVPWVARGGLTLLALFSGAVLVDSLVEIFDGDPYT